MSNSSRRERVAQLATKQHGRIATAQLHALGLTNGNIYHWRKQGYLIRVLPRVYAIGHIAPDRLADLWAAVLYAGPGAAISHATAAHLRGLIDFPPATIEVVTPREIKSIPGKVRVYGGRSRARERVEGVPTCLIPDLIVDLAATGTARMVRRALAQLDYRRQLRAAMITAIESRFKRGRRGSRLTRRMLKRHKPQYAYTNSDIEDLFVDLCAEWGQPPPRCNVKVHGVLVDAYWPTLGLVVEIDGGGNHSTEGQVDHDRTNELILRSHGLAVVRYSKRQLAEDLKLVRRDLLKQMRQASLDRMSRAPARHSRAPA